MFVCLFVTVKWSCIRIEKAFTIIWLWKLMCNSFMFQGRGFESLPGPLSTVVCLARELVIRICLFVTVAMNKSWDNICNHLVGKVMCNSFIFQGRGFTECFSWILFACCAKDCYSRDLIIDTSGMAKHHQK